MIILPTNEGWAVEIICNNGKEIFKILPKKDFKTKLDVETYINNLHGITREDCVKYEILEAII